MASVDELGLAREVFRNELREMGVETARSELMRGRFGPAIPDNWKHGMVVHYIQVGARQDEEDAEYEAREVQRRWALFTLLALLAVLKGCGAI